VRYGTNDRRQQKLLFRFLREYAKIRSVTDRPELLSDGMR